MKTLELIIDMDQIITNLHKKWLSVINREFNYNMTVDDLWHYNVRKCVPAGEKVDEMLGRPGFYRDLEILPGAYEAIFEFHRDNHDILIATSPGSHLECVPDKGAWLKERLPFLNRRNWMFGSPKHRLTGDVFMDDGTENIRSMRTRNDSLVKQGHAKRIHILTIAHPYNAEVAHMVDLRAESWKDTESAWKQKREYVKRLAMES